MNRIQTVLGSAVVASVLMVAPLAASADSLHANASTGVVISQSGIVRVIGADVTAVGNGFIDAVTHIGNVLLSWVVNVSADTKVSANGSKSATTTDVKVGDKVGFMGTLSSSTGSSLIVAATKIRDFTTFPFRHIGEGTVQSVNTANGSFVVVHDGTTVMVQTNASTTISVDGATSTLASLQVGDTVSVVGVANADGSVITASKVILRDVEDRDDKDKHDNDNNNDHDKGHGRGEHEHSGDIRTGLNFLGGFRLGLGKDD